MLVKVDVTQSDIDSGKRHDDHCCPIAKATSRAFHELYHAMILPEVYSAGKSYPSVSTKQVTVMPSNYNWSVQGLRFKANHTDESRRFVKAFDVGDLVFPQTFELDFQLVEGACS